LFSSKGSKDDGLVATFAVLTKTVPDGVSDGMLTTSVKKSSPPTAKLEFEQLTVPLVPTEGVLQLQPAGAEKDTKVIPAGKMSLKVAGLAGSGPKLFTSMV
jgi:hypothetical protein